MRSTDGSDGNVGSDGLLRPRRAALKRMLDANAALIARLSGECGAGRRGGSSRLAAVTRAR